MSFVTDELRPSFSSVRVIVTCSVSTMNADTPRALRVALSVRANRSIVPPNDAFVIHCFAPVSCQPPSTASARLISAPASEPDPGLGQREAPDPVAARERRHEPRALRVAAELENRQRARRRVHGDRHADAGVRARELLEHQDVREEARAGTAVLLRHADAHQAELAERSEQLAWKPVRAIPLGGVRLDLGPREVAGERLDLALLRRELEVHGGHTSAVKIAATALATLALTGCGGHHARLARGCRPQLERRPRPQRQRSCCTAVRGRREGRPERRGRSWPITRPPCSGTQSLPCGGKIVSVTPSGKTDVVVVFRLTERPGHHCDGPGSEAAALFRVRDGRIVLWHQTAPPEQPSPGTV